MRHLLTAGLLATLCGPLAAQTLYVDANRTTGADDGTSWADAFRGIDGLSKALAVLGPGERVFVAQGTYKPSMIGDRSESFTLDVAGDVELYGGFLGVEADPAERPPIGSAPTILSGDLGSDDDMGLFDDNSYHVIRVTGQFDTHRRVIDGFAVTGGNAEDALPLGIAGGGILLDDLSVTSVRFCQFVANRASSGAGAFCTVETDYFGSVLLFSDCVFERNVGGGFAGAGTVSRCRFFDNIGTAVSIAGAFGTVQDSLFYDNQGAAIGISLLVSDSNSLVNGCTVVNNTSSGSVAGIFMSGGISREVRNCIVWGNTASGGGTGSAAQISGPTAVTYSIVDGGYAGTGNLSADPMFSDTAGDDFSLLTSSPAIDAGRSSPSQYYGGDITGRARSVTEPGTPNTGFGPAPVVDIGAFEFQNRMTTPFCTSEDEFGRAGAAMGAAGSESVSANEFWLAVSGARFGVNGFFFYGGQEISLPFGNGRRCVGAGPQGLHRLQPPVMTNSNGSRQRRIDLTSPPSVEGTITPGSTWKFQFWYRTPIDAGFNLSNGLSVTFTN